MPRYDRMIVVPADAVTDTTDGIIRVARMTTTVADIDGIGVGSTISGGTWGVVNGGVKKTSAEADAHRVLVNLNTADRADFPKRGAIQVDLHVPTLAAFATSGSRKLIKTTDAAATQFGPMITTGYIAQ